ncbi:hypothetical protein [Magnetofaba australis]|uniref:Uncharacterized protein n=1 Tax=Magnetofaba australis IT-1 TaxID=1434232 RepID=A0A1Y2K1P9_9PROT|nr:hypothetical protein [Magnetofaba australis]OSM01928.1 hypothetical protein MAIT1_01994 [Magnetofaba australis IT-1]
MILVSTPIPQEGAAPPRRQRLAHALLLTLLLLGVSLALRGLHLWPDQFDQPGWRYPLYHLLRVILLLLLFPLLYGAGRLLLPRPARLLSPRLDRFSHFLACATTGMAAISLLFAGLGMASLYYPATFLTVGAGLAAWSGWVAHEIAAPMRRWLQAQSPLTWGLLAVSVALLVDYAMAEMLALRLENNDVPGSYLPFQDEVLHQTHGFWPTFRLPMFAVMRGAGWSFFVMGLSDHLSASLAGFAALLLLLLLLVRLGAGLCGSLRIAWLGVILLCLWPQGPQAELNLYKTHVIIAAFLVAACYWLILLLNHAAARQSLPVRGAMLTLMAMVVLYPAYLLLLTPLLGWTWLLARWRGWTAARRAAIQGLLWSAAAWGAAIAYNSLTLGHPDLTFERFDALADVARFSEHSSLFIWKLQRVLQGDFLLHAPTWESLATGAGHVLDGSLWRWRPLAILALLGAALLWSALTPRRDGAAEIDLTAWIVLPGFLGSAALALLLNHAVVFRATGFRFAFSLLALLWLSGYVAGRVSDRGQRRRMAGAILLLLALPQPQWPPLRAWDWDFVRGRESFLSVIERQWPGTREAWRLQRMIDPERRILMLNWRPGALMLPGGAYQRPWQNPAMPDLPYLMFAEPAQGRAALLRAGIDVASVDLRAPQVFIASSPLFHPAALRDNFRLLAPLPDADAERVLLTLRADEGEALSEAFLARYDRFFHQGGVALREFDHLYALGQCLWRMAQEPGQPGTDIGGAQNFLASPQQRQACRRQLSPP